MSKFVAIIRNSILLATAVAAATPAFASTIETAPSIAVSYADLDLSNARDQGRLHHRLNAAAKLVCADARDAGSRIQTAYTACVADATTKANTQFAMLTSRSQPKVALR